MSRSRQLAVIMFTDMVGYTTLMGKDEKKALAILRQNKNLHQKLLKQYKGKWLKELGDGVLASFNTISDAVYCAGHLLREAAVVDELQLKIGIHLGEVTVDGEELYGDGVNIASRIEGIAESGQLLVTETIYKNIRNQSGIETSFVGEHQLKNVDEPVKVYAIKIVETPEDYRVSESKENLKRTVRKKSRTIFIALGSVMVLGLVYLLGVKGNTNTGVPDESLSKKSIAVLPFVNISNDPEQEYFVDGMMEEILTHLYKMGDLKVTSRTSAMQYKGANKSIRDIGKELGVAHVLEGSVRKERNNVRITVQLIDVNNDEHVWAENYDRVLEDVFSVQSEVAQQIASILKAEISPEVKERMERIPTTNMEAYNLYLQGNALVDLLTDEGAIRAKELYEKAIEIDPEFAEAYVEIANIEILGATWFARSGGMSSQEVKEKAKELIYKALEIDSENYHAYNWLATINLWLEWDFDSAFKNFEKSRSIYPASYSSFNLDLLLALGRFEEALIEAKRGRKLDPLNSDPYRSEVLAYALMNQPSRVSESIEKAYIRDFSNAGYLMDVGRSYLYIGAYKKVLEFISIFLEQYPENRTPRPLGTMAIAHYHLGQSEKTLELLDEIKQLSDINPGGSPSFYVAMIYAQMGEIDAAFQWLEKAYRDHEVEMYWLKAEPPFEPLHEDPRWQEMLDKVGFP